MQQRIVTIIVAIQIAIVYGVSVPVHPNGLSNWTSELEEKSMGFLADPPPIPVIAEKYLINLNQSTDAIRRKRSSFISPSGRVIAELKNELNELRERIKNLKEAHYMDQSQIASWQSEASRLQRELDNTHQASAQQLLDLNRQMENLTAQVNQLTIRFLPDDCIRSIDARRYSDAAAKIKYIRNQTEIARIVNKVYVGQTNNSYILKEFAPHIDDLHVRALVYEALVRETNNFRDNDIIFKMDLCTQTQFAEAKSISDYLKDSIFTEVIGMWMNSIKHNRYLSNSNIQNISNEIYTRTNLFDELTHKFVNDSFNDGITVNQVCDFFASYTDISQSIYGYLAVFEKIEHGDLAQKAPVIIPLTPHIEETFISPRYLSVSEQLKNKFQRMKDECSRFITVEIIPILLNFF